MLYKIISRWKVQQKAYIKGQSKSQHLGEWSCKQLHIRIDQIAPLYGSERSKQMETSATNFVFLAWMVLRNLLLFTFGLKSTFCDRTPCNLAISLDHNKNKVDLVSTYSIPLGFQRSWRTPLWSSRCFFHVQGFGVLTWGFWIGSVFCCIIKNLTSVYILLC